MEGGERKRCRPVKSQELDGGGEYTLPDVTEFLPLLERKRAGKRTKNMVMSIGIPSSEWVLS